MSYAGVPAVIGVNCELQAGSVAGLMGRNGCGKSSLLWALQGSGVRSGGKVEVDGADPGILSAAQARRLVGLVPQTPGDLLYRNTVAAELADADRDAAVAPGSAAQLLADLAPGIDPATHPRDLSEGQRLALVLAIQLTAAPKVVLLDEPTRGLDYRAKEQLAAIVQRLADEGRCVLLASHDVEFVAESCDRVIVMAGGEVVADGSTAEILATSPAFAPQVARVLMPMPYLTVEQVAAALDAESVQLGDSLPDLPASPTESDRLGER